MARHGDANPAFYVDGVGQPVADGGGAATINLYPSTEPLQIGAQVDTASGWYYYSSALVDEVSLYNTALSAAQILAIYNAGVAGKCPEVPPWIVTQPESQRAPAGSSAFFDALAGGSYPLSYQWRFNGTDLPGATAPALMLTGLQSANSGSYSLLVTNPWGWAVSTDAVLEVYSPACLPPPDGLVGWWAAEGNAYDALCQHNGTTHGGVSFDPQGQVGYALSFDGVTGQVQVPDAPALRLTSELTIEFWARRRNLQSEDYIINKGGDFTRGALNYGVTLNSSQYGGKLAFTFAGGYRRSVSIANTNWHHIAVVARQGDANPAFYVDGAAQPVTDSGGAATINLYASTEPLHIGAQVDSVSGWYYYSSALVDEVTLYNTALSADQIQAIYQAGAGGKCNIPAVWQEYYFGPNYQNNPLAGVTADADGDGESNLQEWFNGTDPNQIAFLTSFPNDHVNMDIVSGSIELQQGIPNEMAVLVNSTNFAQAAWSAYNTVFSAALPATDGTYEVWVGLRGFAPDSQQTWDRSLITRDTHPPAIVITNLAPATISCPLIQVQGFSPEPLASLSCDLSNALGLTTNLTILVLDQYYDTNRWQFTTNSFQAFDLQLTNGLNTITLYATDLAGNASTTNLTLVLTNDSAPPFIALTWPQNGKRLCGDTFTLDGWLDDPSASVQVSLVDSDGITNTFGGLVERDGRFWAEDLPLAAGTNVLALTATDAWGNPATTNIIVYKSDLALGFSLIDPSQLFQPTIALRGTVSDPGCTVWVNGIQAVNNGDGTWQATGVPVNPGGTASFAAVAYPAGHDLEASAASQAKTNVDLPDRIFVQSDEQSWSTYNHTHWNDYDEYGNEVDWGDSQGWREYTHWWENGAGGNGEWLSKGVRTGPWGGVSELCTAQILWMPAWWPNLPNGTQTAQGDCDWAIMDPVQAVGPPLVGMDHCEVSDPKDSSWSGFYLPDWDCWEWGTEHKAYVRHSQTKLKLFTGGKAIPGRQSLFVLSGWARELLDKRAAPPYIIGTDFLYPFNPLPNHTVIIGDLGPLGSDGLLYKALPDRATVDVTPLVRGRQFYWFNVTEQKHKPYVTTNGVLLEPDKLADAAAFSVGQKIVFEASFDIPPTAIKKTDCVCSFPGDYRNARKYALGEDYFIATCYPQHVWDIGQRPIGDTGTPCTQYLIYQPLLFEESTGAWWISEGIKKLGCLKTITFSNSQEVTVPCLGKFYVSRPDVFLDGIQQRYFTGGWSSGVGLGNYHAQDGGMVYNINFMSDVSGTGAITQLIQADYAYPPGPNFSDYRLDGIEVYESAPIFPVFDPRSQKNVYFSDYPCTPLFSGRLKANFKDYIRFMPDGDDNIYATIAIVTWNMWGEVTIGGTWTHQDTPDPSEPVDSTELPTWTNSYP